MRQRISLEALPSLPRDPSQLLEGPIAFLHSGNDKGIPMLAMGEAEGVWVEYPGKAFDELETFLGEKADWAFGFFGYELKDELEGLSSSQERKIGFPALHFFRPKVLFHLQSEATIAEFLPETLTEEDVKDLHRGLMEQVPRPKGEGLELKPRIERSSYLRAIEALQDHIQKGDIYEVNFCQEFFAENVEVDPFRTFNELQTLAGAPMAAFYRLGNASLLCASPERFLKVQWNRVLAQPIKGTAPRGRNEKQDRELAEKLRTDPKERAENTMIVDLVRNDLSRTAARGTVKVEELCGVHPFPTVHQMISSIRSELGAGYTPLDLIRSAFPMGSMTGAPKIRAMELIEEWEGVRRGLYSGSVGYVDPSGNWDLNVVIRSLLYDARDRYLSAMVGGAITARSDPQKEYEECLLKAEALKKAIA